MKRRPIYFIMLFILLTLTSTSAQAEVIENSPVIDGVISASEYSSEKSFFSGEFSIYWELVNSSIYFGLSAKTTGWIAIGINPSTGMLNADLIYGWVEASGSVVIFDAFSRTQAGDDHPEDTDMGGTYDILDYNGTESDGVTTIEFSRLLSTGDTTADQVINENSQLDIIWGMGNADSFTDQHTIR